MTVSRIAMLALTLAAGQVIAAELPSQGKSMAAVEKQFGAPTQKLDPVGKPAITRWVYPGYVVYFERQTVIHAVTTGQNTVEEVKAPATKP